ncbi:MAG TPA: site-specific integrase [Opitutaceae bacterium]|nr:site-specific integrase [Opitutaceae bacterium]
MTFLKNTAVKFEISEFTNPSGEIVFRVAGWLNGKRVRKNLASRAEAQAERQALEIAALQSESGMRVAATRLADDQLREAEAAFHRLEGRARSLAFYLDYALSNYRDPVNDMSLADAAKLYLAVREADEKLGHISHRQFTAFRCELRALIAAFPGKKVAELAAGALTDYFRRDNASKKTFNNRRGLVGSFLRYCLLRDWVATNVVEKIAHHRGIGHRRGSAPTLSGAQCAEIMEWAETEHGGALVPFIALCLFAGIRPDLYVGEISKLEPKHVRLDTGVITIEPEVSKVRMKRTVAIQPNLAAWLRAYPLESFPIWPRGFKRLRLAFRKKFNLSHDILRHTFISMFVGKFRSLGEAALQAGNSESIIKKHYLDLKTREEAEEFFSILPKKAAVPAAAKLSLMATAA